jgi:5-methylcytosine-specific restriction endonuclease McrA
VHERDGTRCRFVDEEGRRCTARAWLQFHHRHTYAVGGEHSLANVTLLCKTHNQYMATIDYGRAAMDGYGRKRASSSG